MERNKNLAVERNQQGFTPLHLAASKGYLDMVKHMLSIDKEEDQSGRTPLHCAVMRGKSDVVQQLIKAYPETALKRTQRGETLLHLAVINNQFRALGPLIGFLREQNLDMNAFFNSQDEFGQTILHLAVELQNLQMVKLIVNEASGNVSARNSANLTALDMAERTSIADGSVDSKDIKDVLRAAATGTQIHNDHRIHINNDNQMSSSSDLDPKKEKVSYSVVMVVAVLLATQSFQAALNPPGGLWTDWGNTSRSTTQVQRSRISSVDAGEAPSPQPPSLAPSAPQSLYIYNLLMKYLRYDMIELLPININVGDDKRHMPGKSISRELYPDSFFEFIYDCGLCFFFSTTTLLVLPLVPYTPVTSSFRLYFLCSILYFSVGFGVNAFFSGIALVTDLDVSIWLRFSTFHTLFLIYLIVLSILVIAFGRRWRWRWNWLKWMANNISWCCSRLKTTTWLLWKSVALILIPLIAIFLSYASDAIRQNYGTEDRHEL